MTLSKVIFDGNIKEPTDKLFEYVVGPTRERYSKLQKNLPFVAADIEEGADLVHRLYVAEGFLDSAVDKPHYTYHDDINQVDVVIPIREGRQYFFGNVSFTGKAIYDSATLRGQIQDLLEQPYTDARVADIPRRLQAYYKARGYYDIKAEVTADPTKATSGRVPVQVAISPGPVYHFGDVTVSGLTRLHPSFVEKRFVRLKGQTYSPDVLDEKFRTLMRTGLFNLLRISPTPVDGDTLDLDIAAEEAKSKQLGFLVGYGTFEDPFFFDTEINFKNRIAALTYDFDGYSKFEIGDRIEFSQKLTKQYQVGLNFSARHVEVTSADINVRLLGQTSYFIDTLGFTQTYDRRESPLVAPRGFIAENTF